MYLVSNHLLLIEDLDACLLKDARGTIYVTIRKRENAFAYELYDCMYYIRAVFFHGVPGTSARQRGFPVNRAKARTACRHEQATQKP